MTTGSKDQYIIVPVLKVSQKGKGFYIGKMLFSDFENAYTRSPAEYKRQAYALKAEEDDRFNDLSLGIDEYFKRQASNLKKGFQRDIDLGRINEIKKYIIENDFGIIPNSVIVNLVAIEVESEDDFDATIADNTNMDAILFQDRLYVHKQTKPFLIIDGQHRVEGCKLLPKEMKDDFELLFTFIVNVDPVVQAQLFTTINYKVKPVNKSYLYQILGEFEIETSEYTFLHEIVKLLNEFPNSPLYDRVKMLGKKVSPLNTLSQAFLVEFFYLLLCPKYTDAKILADENQLLRIPVCRFHYCSREKRRVIPKFLLMYFLAIKKLLKSTVNIVWENNSEHILLRTLGMGALITIIPNVYVSLLFKKELLEKQEMITEVVRIDDIEQILKPLFEINLKNEPENEFSKGSSRGLVRKLALTIWKPMVRELPGFYEFHKSYIKWFNEVVVKGETK
jgi:DGQHR domain-containing protein